MKFLDGFGARSGGARCDHLVPLVCIIEKIVISRCTHEMINSWQDDEAGMKGAGDAAEAQSSEMIVRDLRGALAPAQEPPPLRHSAYG